MEGLKLSQPSWLAVLLACVLFIPEAFAIDVSLSVDDGGESASLESSYDVDTDVAVSEESIAGADQPGIENARSVSGTGNINAVQSYSGSSGYRGRAILNAEGASGTLQSDALLTSQNVGATQDISLSGNSVDTGMSLFNEGDSADLSVTISSGTIDSSQSIQTGSVDNRILANIEAQLILYRQLVNILSNEVNSLTKISTPTGSPVVLNAAANSHTGSNMAFQSSGGNINVDDSKKVTGPSGSQVNSFTQVTNAKSCDYRYYLNSIDSRENRVTLNVKDADYISASVYAGKGWTYPIWMSRGECTIGSEASVYVYHGSLEGYSNKAYFDGTNFIASQSARLASGFSPDQSSPAVSYYQTAYNAENGARGSIWTSSKSKEDSVNGFSGTATSTDSKVNVDYQIIGKASGDIVSASSSAYGATTADASTYVRNGEINSYSSSVAANKDRSASSQDVQSALGESITIDGGTYHGDLSDWSNLGTVIFDGSIKGYSSDAFAQVRSGSIYSSSSSQDFSFAKGNLVRSLTGATPYDLYDPSARHTTTYIEVTNGDLGTYHDKSTIENGAVKLSQSFGTANGDIEAWRYRYPNWEKDITAQVNNGFMIGYANDAYVDDERISFTQGSNYAKGDSVNLHQHISNQEGDDVHGSVWADKGSVGSYYSTVNAIDSKVDFSQDISSATGNQVFADSSAAHIENGRHTIDGQVSTNLWNNPTLSGYHSFAETKKDTSPLGRQETYSATSSQDVDSASGGSIYFSGTATKNRADGFGTEGSASASTSVDGGSVGHYSNSVTAEKISSPIPWANVLSARSSQNIITASGNSISVGLSASNDLGGESANIFTKIAGGASDGQLNGYYDESKITGTKATASANINANGASSIDVKSHAENQNAADERLSSGAVHYGGGDFEVKSDDNLKMSISNSATSDSIKITPTLSASVKSALILEPYRQFPLSGGATDMGTTVFPSLVNSGYAATRYTDSAASRDKFTGLDSYNVVLVLSHMGQDHIALSTGTGSSNAVHHDELNYNNPPSKSLVILAGCESFEPVWFMNSDLEKSVEKAYLRAGYEKEVSAVWAQDSIGRLFQNMAAGMTFSEANSDVWDNYRFDWCNLHGLIASDTKIPVELIPYGNTDFRLQSENVNNPFKPPVWQEFSL